MGEDAQGKEKCDLMNLVVDVIYIVMYKGIRQQKQDKDYDVSRITITYKSYRILC